MSDELPVYLFNLHAGVLQIDGALRSPEDWRFIYDKNYLAQKTPIAISVALPLRDEVFEGAVVRNWFSNLLPEGAVRETIERRMRLSSRDDFALLAAIGGECAGAVSVGSGDNTLKVSATDETDLETLLSLQGNNAGDGAWAALGMPMRLSLAGAQDKIAVIRESDGRLRLPAMGEASTYILKPDSNHIRGIRDLEALGLALAATVGLRVAKAELTVVAGRNALLIERYDRQLLPDGSRIRLHQEDFCQALGYPGELKYESQGGPSLANCAALIRDQLRMGPVALHGFLDWVVFSALIGNADAHAKNLSLLCGLDGRRKLAPLYDLVPTLSIPESMVDRAPALRIGRAERIDSISADDWQIFATQTGYAPSFVLMRVKTLADELITKIEGVAQSLITQGADEVPLQKAVIHIKKNCERMRY